MDQEKLSKAMYDLELQIYGKNAVPIVSTDFCGNCGQALDWSGDGE